MIARRMCANCMAECQGSRSINSLFLHKCLQQLRKPLQVLKVADDLNPCFYLLEAGNLCRRPVGFVQSLRQPVSAHRRAEFDGVAFDRGFNSSGFLRMTMFDIKAKAIDMNSSLTPELQKFVGTKLESGRRNSASEVVREALRLLEEHDQARAGQLAEFNRELGRRLDSLDRGQRIDPADARARLQRKSEARRKSGG